ncbi:MAG: hypothetical protein HYY85_04135 [Deltaproteobacteria bacterium]|nr:hypothetical protein [Deltaproteobacteria bacterium]
MRRLLAVGIVVAAVLWASPGRPQQEVIDRLQQQLQQLQEQQQRLQQQLDEVRRQQETQRQQQEQLQKKQEEAAKAPLLAGWDRAPFVRTADDRFRLGITGRADVNTALFLADTTQRSQLWIRRFRLGFEGHVYKNIEYTFEIQADARLGSVTGEVELRYFYVDLMYFKDWGVPRVGQFKMPFSLEQMTGSSSIETVERSIVTDEIPPGRDLGIGVFGENLFGFFNYGVAVFQGEGDNASESDGGKDFSTRIFVRPIKGLHLGGSYRAGVHNASGHRMRLRTPTGFEFFRRDTRGLLESWGLEGKVEWRGAKLQSEFSRRTDERINVLSTGTANASDVVTEGWYVQLSYMLWGDRTRGGLEPVLKLERVRADNKDDVSANFPDTRAQIWHLGLNYWLGRHARVQLFWLNQQLHNAQDRNGAFLSTRGNGRTNVTDNVILTRFTIKFP